MIGASSALTASKRWTRSLDESQVCAFIARLRMAVARGSIGPTRLHFTDLRADAKTPTPQSALLDDGIRLDRFFVRLFVCEAETGLFERTSCKVRFEPARNEFSFEVFVFARFLLAFCQHVFIA